MARDFNSKNDTRPLRYRAIKRIFWDGEVYTENRGSGPPMIKDTNFVERTHYGLIDDQNNSIIPNINYIVNTQHGRVFDFVADSYSLMRLNWTTALQKNLVSLEGSAFENLKMEKSYENPKIKYGEYLGNILRFYNDTHIPNVLGVTNITSYEKYVKNFFNFILKEPSEIAITMTRWNTSKFSNVLDTGLAFSYSDIPYDADQQKVDQIIDHPSYEYFKNLSLNMGFSILHNTPNILLYDLRSPATAGIRMRYGLLNLSNIFSSRFIKTYTIDNNMLYNNINIYYNKYALRNRIIKSVDVKCGKTVSNIYHLNPIPITKRLFNDSQQLELYCQIRNHEEGLPFSLQKVKNIIKKAKYFLKKVDKAEAMSYINSEFKDQVWNKDHGYHDLRQKVYGKTMTQAEREQTGTIPSRRSTTPSRSGGSSSGGSSSSY